MGLRASWRSGVACGLLLLAGRPACASPAPDPESLFQQAVAADLGQGGRSDAAAAFRLYRAAAEAGLAVAQLNTAVMLDSGRGVAQDPTGAATYYALAASQGIARAAYDLGQLYADGEGVPANPGLARAWLKLAVGEGLTAAAGLLDAMRVPVATGATALPTAPDPRRPASLSVFARPAALQLVWTAGVQPDPPQFFVEVALLDGPTTRRVFDGLVNVSAITVPVTLEAGRYAWRVFTVCPSLGRYAPSPWVVFSVS